MSYAGYFGSYQERQKFLDESEAVSEEIWRNHVAAFIQNFVVQAKRARYRHLCLEKPEKAKTARIHNDLIWTLCSKGDFETEIPLNKRKEKFVYYAFSGKAWWLSPSDALLVGHGYDSIYSIREGEICVYFWHELEEFLCKKPVQDKF